MSNVKKEEEFLNTGDFIELLAKRASFSRGDVKIILDEMRTLLEECIVNNIDVDLRGLFHLSVDNIEYINEPGMITYHGKTTFNKKAKIIRYRVPLNFKKILKREDSKLLEEEKEI